LTQDEKQKKRLLAQAVDQALLTLGESAREAVYFHLQKIVLLNKDDVPDNLDVFEKGLEKIFGAGAKMIEITVVKSLCQQLRIEFEEKKNISLVDYVDWAMEKANAK
jgi:hypothetical protein